MANVFHYLKQYQHHPFASEPINEVDYLLLNELIYLPFDIYLTQEHTLQNPLSLSELASRYELNESLHQAENTVLAKSDRHKLLTMMGKSLRYADVQLAVFQHHYSKKIEKQFCAATLLLPNQTIMVAFRGTDDTLVGWKEDFKLAYQKNIPAQLDATVYLENIMAHSTEPIIVTGHSKGGNLALYASILNDNKRLKEVYLFDSPGLTEEMTQSPAYQNIKPRIKRYIPEDTVVGAMMYHDIEPIIIKSSLISVFQHNIFLWQVNQTQLTRTEKTTNMSQLLDKTIKMWCNQHTTEELETFFDYSFGLLQATGATTLGDISKDFVAFAKKFQEIQQTESLEQKTAFDQLSAQLLNTWKTVYLEYQEQRWQHFRQEVDHFWQGTGINDNLQAVGQWFQSLGSKD